MEQIATALLDSVLQQQSTVTINGVPQGGRQVKTYFLKCGNCNKVLANFNPGEKFVTVASYCQSTVKNDLIYCPNCGRKLDYTMDLISMKEACDESSRTAGSTESENTSR